MNKGTGTRIAFLAGLAGLAMSAGAGTFTGNPAADGWAFVGHSLANGVYSRGTANNGFDIYTTGFTVSDSSAYTLPGHEGAAYDNYYGLPNGGRQWDTSAARAWEAGHTVIGLGGVFAGIGAGDAGWSEFSGPVVNSGLPSGSGGLRLQAKFGTADGTWTTSTVAPSAGNGGASTADGGLGTVFVRTSGFLFLGDNAWQNYAGEIMGLQELGHISRTGTSAGVDAARLIWEYDEASQRPIAWQILLNTSLLGLDADAGFAGLMPGFGDIAVASVQNGNGPFTDALVQVVPTPGAIALFGLAGFAAARRRR